MAERFLNLSPEEIYALARPEGHGEGEETVPAPARLPHPADESYRILVQRVTETLLGQSSLPTYEQWAEAYGETPERFDAELLGFWKDVAEEDG